MAKRRVKDRSFEERAMMMLNLDKEGEAVNLFAQAVEIYQKHYGPNHAQTQEMLQRYVTLLQDRGRPLVAEALRARMKYQGLAR